MVVEGSADPKRIYVTGLSNGGAYDDDMVFARADLFAAAASVIMNLTDELAGACHPSRPMPMLMMNGTVDPFIPSRGRQGHQPVRGGRLLAGRRKRWRSGASSTAARLGDGAVTDLDDRYRDDQITVTRIELRCPPARDVVLYRVNGGGHRMPGTFSDARFPRIATAFSGRKITTSTAPRPSGRSSRDFRRLG